MMQLTGGVKAVLAAGALAVVALLGWFGFQAAQEAAAPQVQVNWTLEDRTVNERVGMVWNRSRQPMRGLRLSVAGRPATLLTSTGLTSLTAGESTDISPMSASQIVVRARETPLDAPITGTAGGKPVRVRVSVAPDYEQHSAQETASPSHTVYLR